MLGSTSPPVISRQSALAISTKGGAYPRIGFWRLTEAGGFPAATKADGAGEGALGAPAVFLLAREAMAYP